MSDLPPPPDALPTDTFDVVFARRSAPAGAAGTPLAWAGRGTASFVDGDLLLRGRRPRPFRAAESEQWRVPLHAITNVVVEGDALRFDARTPTGALAVHLVATGADAAAHIAARLPDTLTAAFVAEQAQLAEFHERIATRGSRWGVTHVIIALNVAVFAVMAANGAGVMTPDAEVIIRWGSNFGPLTMTGEWWRLLTSTFIHFGLLHLLLNMWALHGAGELTERLFGRARFIALYLFAGLAGSIGSLLWNPAVNSAGASGAIFGVFGALLAYVLDGRNGVPRSVIAMHRNSTLAFVGYNLFYGAIHPGIDNAAHIGGLVGGLVAGFALARPIDRPATSRGAPWRMAAAIVLLVLAAVPLLQPSPAVRSRQRFTRAMLDFPAREHAAVDAMRGAFERGRAGTRESDVAAATLLRDDVAPRWDALHRSLVVDAPLPARDAERQRLLIRYVDGRRDQAALLARSVFENDAALQARAIEAGKQADAALAQLNAQDR